MFTGLIDHCGEIIETNQHSNGLTVTVQSQFDDLQEGESIAVDGICLTAIACEKSARGYFKCDLSPETLQLTTAAKFKTKQKVNLERALRVGERLGGHWVTGHVDQQAIIKTVTKHSEYTELQIFHNNPQALAFLIKKGSIAVNGVSLTINELNALSLQIMLIPHTLERTNLSALMPEDKVNLEFDYLAKIVVNQVKSLEIFAK